MMNNPKVSIVVPCYKVEKYLRRCLDSLVNQTLDDIEIICINDGSPDNCLKILNEYKKKYFDKIIIIDKKNEGVWNGRVDGIKKATGKYIAFTDADDYVTLDYAEKMYISAEKNNSDILICSYYRVDSYTGHIYSTEMNQFEGKHIDMNINPEDILSINTALWNKLYKAEILKKIDNFENPPQILEDMMYLSLVYLNAKNIDFINEPLYYYMVRRDSTMGKINKLQIEKTEKAMIRIKEIYSNDDKGKKLLEVIDSMAFLHFGISLMFRLSDDKDFKNILIQNEDFLNKYFSKWKTTKYLKISYTKRHNSNCKIAYMRKIYANHLLRLFFKMYKWILKIFKIDIKW